ncbi:hypothetical protein [Janthinobacterium sp. PSPC3-1]|uniref:hypothetical protein n=1 Tax=Janthinobacterium sp. PSPC3-1 TaxID=2804653 RepID=UPI003CF0383B
MKFKFNLYLVIAVAIIGTITGSLAASLGSVEPALTAAIILLSVLVLGWGAGTMSSCAEIERLTGIEEAHRIRANCLITARSRLEGDLEQLRDVRGAVGDLANGGGHAA